ncbi:hypothetical protein F5J12DRAFT_32601 [Pisolithus orientalis]|uniref:uncharacterized protein n=1 Tax=Pisolithus orientalis TaxID=936130 RepID=UPI00222567A0|nr:uncharacterized protein F5J12DRAFT_32601 [Pisolithus orientalis]KAI6035590.1 hypothetical protein F5J12DRAFT_32601 [Pisolithus orientalis]
MSISVDDLVASLSSHHIGQEALELAALQAQLAQSLLAHQFSSSSPHFQHPHLSGPHPCTNIARRDPGHVQHCTTPTSRTPSSSAFIWPLPVQELASHSRRSSISSIKMQQCHEDIVLVDMDDADEEDARLVEAMVTPSDVPSKDALNSFSVPTSHQLISPMDPSCSPSLFTTTDPFYIQTSQAAAAQQSLSTAPGAPGTASFFALAGRPNAHSPFAMGTSAWQR